MEWVSSGSHGGWAPAIMKYRVIRTPAYPHQPRETNHCSDRNQQKQVDAHPCDGQKDMHRVCPLVTSQGVTALGRH